MIFGQELAIAAPVNARLTTTAIATIAFFILSSPPLRARLFRQGSALGPLTAYRPHGFPRGLGVRRRRAPCRRMKVLVDALRELRRHLGHRRQLGHGGVAYAARRAERLEQARADRRPPARNGVEHRLDRSPAAQLLVVGDRSEERRVGEERRSRWSPYH